MMHSKFNKKKSQPWILTIFFLLFIGVAASLHSNSESFVELIGNPDKSQHSRQTKGATLDLDTSLADAEKNPSEVFIEQIKEAALQVGQLQESPDQTQNELEKLATKLTKNEIETLERIILQTHHEQDLRAFCVYLLSLSPNSASLESLERIALEQNETTPQIGEFEFQQTIKAMAIEGLGKQARPSEQFDNQVKSLQKIANQTDQAFLADRANRELQALKRRSPSAETQDKRALSQLLSQKKAKDPSL